MIINANTIIPEFSQANLSAVIDAYPLGNLQYRTLFPLEFNPTLSFGSLESAGNAKVMADIVAIGSRAPRKGRDFIDGIKGEIPKVEIARDLNEKDLLTIQNLRNSAALYPKNEGVRNQLYAKIYEDAPFCIDGVNARMEWMAKQLISTGKYVTAIDNNAGGVQNVVVDFKVKTQNAAKDWFSAADADPIAEIQKIQDTANGQGFAFSTMVMERDTLNKLLASTSVRQFVFGLPVSNNTVLPLASQDAFNAQLSGKGLPSIVLWESYISAEKKDGSKTAVKGWEQGNIFFSVDSNLGNTQYTTTTEFSMNFADTMSKSIKDDFILVTTYGHQDPIMVSTKATAFATPVLNNTKKNLILKTKLA